MKKHTTFPFSLIAMSSMLIVIVIAMVAVIGMVISAESPSTITYQNPITSTTIHRITNNAGGPDKCVNFLAAAAGASSNWSQDSQRIVYTRTCDEDPTQNGIYVYDIQDQKSACLAQTAGRWTYPIFDHSPTGEKIYFIDRIRDYESHPKSYAIYTVDVDSQLDYDRTCAGKGKGEIFIDLRALGGDQLTDDYIKDVILLTKNNIQNGGNPLFATHIVHVSGKIRTIIFTLDDDPDQRLLQNWNFNDTQNPPHNNRNDGDTSIWSPHDPDLIFTNRGTSATDQKPIIGVWSIKENQNPLYQPFVSNTDCHFDDHNNEDRDAIEAGNLIGDIQISHTAWGWHPQTNKEIFIGSDRCPWTRTVDTNGYVTETQNNEDGFELHGQLHLSFAPTSFNGNLSGIRFVADEYTSGSSAEPFLYEATLEDIGINQNGFSGWSGIRSDRKLVWHRNKFEGFNDDQKPYEPHPNFSPDGQYVLWQSNSLTQFPPLSCTGCGDYGGEASKTLYTDLYLVKTGNGQTQPTPTPNPTATPPPNSTALLHTFEDGIVGWRTYKKQSNSGIQLSTTSGYNSNRSLQINYQVPTNGFAAAHTYDLPIRDWRNYHAVEFAFYGQNTGDTLTFEIFDVSPNGNAEIYRASFIDNESNWRTVPLPLDSFIRDGYQPDNAPDDGLNLLNISRIDFKIDKDAISADTVVRIDDIILTTLGSPTPTPPPTATSMPEPTATPSPQPTATPSPTPIPTTTPPPSNTVLIETFEDGNSWGTYSEDNSSVTVAIESGYNINQSLEIEYVLYEGQYAGAKRDLPQDNDWSDYNSIEFDFFGQGTGEEYDFIIRNGSDYQSLVFQDDVEGWTVVELQLDNLNRNRVNWIGLQIEVDDTGGQSTVVRTVRLDNIRLSQSVTVSSILFIDDFTDSEWRYWGSGPLSSDGITITENMLSVEYDLPRGKYNAIFTDDMLVRDWTPYQAVRFDFKGENTGREIKFMVYASNEIYTKTFVDNSPTWQSIEIELDTLFGENNLSQTNISRIVYQLGKIYDADAQNRFQIRKIELVD